MSSADPPIDRRALRAALLDAEPWLAETEVGPAAVAAGTCDRCGFRPRLLPTCGPRWEALCRDCALAVGPDGWCDGHAADGAEARTWAAALPDTWATTVLVWWFATGELRHLDPAAVDLDRTAPSVRALVTRL